MNIRKKILSFISVSVFMFITIAGVSVFATSTNDTKINTTIGYNYPVKPGTVEWDKLGNKVAREKSCQIPEEILKNLTTDELIETVLNYPFLMDIYAYDSYQKGFKAVSERFNGLNELLQREDVADKLITKYKNTEVAEDTDKVASGEIFDLSNIEILLGQDEVLNQLAGTNKDELEKEVETKYMEKKKHKDIYGVTCATSYKVQAEKQDSLVSAQATIYVSTPKGSLVEVIELGELLTEAEKIESDSWVKSTYPGVGLLRSATTNYNCHSYAWYSQAYKNTYWLNDPKPYMTDGSYMYQGTTSGYGGERVYYSVAGNEHSGIVYNRVAGAIGPDAYQNVNVLSKWGHYGLVRHSAQNCPYYASGLALQFYKKI